MTTYEFPWKTGSGVCSNDAPQRAVDVTYHGHCIRFTPTSETDCDTGRTRVHVECLTCKKVLHEATTGPRTRARHHWDDVKDLQLETRKIDIEIDNYCGDYSMVVISRVDFDDLVSQLAERDVARTRLERIETSLMSLLILAEGYGMRESSKVWPAAMDEALAALEDPCD